MRSARILYCFVILSFFIMLPVLVYGQHELVIPAPTGPGDYLNDHIVGDTTAGGARVDSQRVYVLERNGVYIAVTSIRNRGWDMKIRAEEGAGRAPVIYALKNPVSGAMTDDMFRVDGAGGNVWFKDLIFCGIIEADTSQYHNIPTNFIRVDAAGFDITVENCMMTNTRGQVIRCEGATGTVRINNCIWANMGDLERSNLGAGKGIDIRATSCDSLIFTNNTFVNWQDRIIRHRASTGALNHLIFDHNTLVNGFSYHGTLALGWMGTDAVITNNLWLDAFVAGQDTDASRQAEFNESKEKDEFGLAAMNWIFTQPDSNTNVNWTIAGNYHGVSPAVQAFYDRHAAEGVQGEGAPLTHHINGKLGADSTNAFVKEVITLTNTPEPMVNMGDWYRNYVWGAGKTKTTSKFVRARDDFDRKTWVYLADTLDCGYADTCAAATGSTTSGQVGDLRWTLVPVSGLIDMGQGVAQTYKLHQNYPNPFNPSTKIAFTINKLDRVRLEVYNITGQKIATLLDQKMKPGSHEVEWNASQVASGVYFYKFSFGSLTMTKKMVLIR
jgi:hypothetical protein